MSLAKDVAGNSVIAETRDFKAFVGKGEISETFKGHTCYRVLNKRTGVIEAEGNSEAMTIRGVHSLQEQLDNVKKDPEGVEARAEQDRLMALLSGAGIEPGGESGPATPVLN